MSENDAPLVSIGLPVFNGEKFLQQALGSLLAQSFSNFELIISDNASTDKTEKICGKYATQDARIRYIRQSDNIGALENFNFVLDVAKGKYFMWAAVDDQWDSNFIQILLEKLQERPKAIGAFCPYQWINEETGEIIEGVLNHDYENPFAFFRLLKFTWTYRDMCIYGLMRREALNNLKFQPWAWINVATPYNIAYPMVYHLLAKGNFLTVGDAPLWYKTIAVKQGHSAPFKSNPLLGYFAHIVRKINLFLRSIRYIYIGSKSISLSIFVVPFLFFRLLRDSVVPIYAAFRIIISGRKISELSPHEIWRLGVR